MSDLTLGLRIRVNDDGSVQAFNRTSQGLRDVSASAQQASRSTEDTRRSFSQTALSALSMGDALRSVGAGLSIMSIALSSKEIIQLADKMTLLDSRIKIATSTVTDYANSSKELVAISLRTGTSFESNATIFSRINKAMEEMGGTTRHTTALTETLAQTMRISGTSTEEAASTIRQMSQALASGLLRGDEFNSIMENSPRLSQALADGMHVGIGALRAMAEAGELNSKRVIEAIQSQGKTIDDEFKHIPLTVGTAMTNISTAFGQYVIEVNKGSGATAGLAQNLNTVAHNLTPIIDGIITSGKISATVFAGQMAGSLVSYISAKRAATAAEVAHSLSIAENRQSAISNAQATISRMDVQLGYIRAQQATVAAEVSTMQASIVASQATMNQARATLIATDATIQSTSVLYIRQQALASMIGAETALVATEAELAVAQQRQAVLSGQIATSMTAQTAATRALAIAQQTTTVAAASLTTQLRGMLSVMGLINVAMGVFVAFEAKNYLNDLYTGSDFAAKSMGALATWIEEVSRRGALLKAVFTSDTWDEVNAASEKTKQSYINLTNELLRNNAAARNHVALSGEMQAELAALKSPQEVYNQRIKDANEASKTLDSSTKKMMITEEQRLALGKKALDAWEKANAAEANAKKTDAGKEIVKLQDQYDKLTLSTEDYNKKHAEGIAGTATEVAEVIRLSNAIAAAEENKKSLGKTSKELAKDEKSLQTAYDNTVSSMELSLAKTGDHAKTAAMEYQVTKGELKGLNEAQKLRLLQLAAESEYQDKVNKSESAAKSSMDSLIDQYNKLTLSARDYYAETLKKDGISPEKAAPMLKQFDKNLAVEGNKNKIDDARKELESYNSALDSSKDKMADLGSISSSVFDGALGGISAMAGAFANMVGSINENTAALDELHKRQAKVNNFQPSLDKDKYLKDLTLKQELTDKNAKQEADLTAKNTALSLAGVRQMAGASASMFAENSKGRKTMHAMEMTLGAIEMAMNIKSLASKGAAAVLNQGEGDPYSAFARIAAMTAIVGGIIAAAGGAFSGGGGGSAMPATSPTTGTVLGDASAQSDSVNKTYELLKSIHAEEYAELKGINRGVAGLSSGITNVVTRLFQAGGIVDPNIDTSSKLSSTAKIAENLATAGTAAFAIFAAPWTMGLSMLAPLVLKHVPIIGDVLNGISDFIFGGLFGKVSRSVVGGGILTAPTSIGSIMDGGDLYASQYATIETKKKSWFSTKKSYSEIYSAVADDVQASLNQVFKSMGSTMLGVADTIGNEIGTDLGARVTSYIIPAMRVELRGLSGDDASKKLNGVISTALDTMAGTVFGDILGQYQKLGEGMLETAIRIVSEVAVVKDALAKSGLSLASNALYIADSIAQAAGGLEEFQKQFGTYFDKFYTDAEKQSDLQKRLSTALDGSLATTREGYRKQIEALDLSNAKDLERYALLIKMAGAADQYYTAVEAAAAATEAILKTLSDNVATGRSNLTNAYKNEAAALTAAINKFDEFGKSLQKFKDGLLVGDLSPGAPGDKYTAAKAQFNDTLNLINAGPGTTDAGKAAYEKAQADLQAKAQSFLSVSRDFNASGAAYKTDWQAVMSAIDASIISADAAKTDAQQQLDALNASVDGLITINESVLSVKDAIELLNANVEVQNATKYSLTAKAALEDATAKAANSSAQLAGLQNTADSDARALASSINKEAGLNALVMPDINHASWRNSSTDNPVWDQTVIDWNLVHTASYGEPMNRPWTADGDAVAAYYNWMVPHYTNLLVNEIASANVGGLAATAATSVAAVADYAAIAGNDSAARDLAQTGYDNALSYVDQLKQALLDKQVSINGSHRSGLYRVPYDGYIAELHRDERVLTAQESSDYNRQVNQSGSAPRQAPMSQSDKQLIDELKQSNKELQEQNRHLKASVAVMQAGFKKLIEQNNNQSSSLDNIERYTRASA